VQKRLVWKLDLKFSLSKIKPHPRPRAYFEQYTIPSDLAAEILFIAAYVYDDIIGKTVIDLGCGTGRLAIGAALLGAEETIGIDIDRLAIDVARKNSKRFLLKDKTHWIVGDISVIVGHFDTVLQNPPFGVQRRGADRKFIKKSLEIARKIYSLHKSSMFNQESIKKLRSRRTKVLPAQISPFLKGFISAHGGEIKAVYAMVMTISQLFKFHKKQRHRFIVDLYIMNGKLSNPHVHAAKNQAF
jgi:putative methylase